MATQGAYGRPFPFPSEGIGMKVKLLRSLLWDRQHCEAGTVLEVDQEGARYLLGRAAAIEWTEAQDISTHRATIDKLDGGIKKRATKRKTDK